ncbi:LacI family DNA-binding transcriptional regulator [Arenivirga flava]|uniref:LacI family transcriptional regulator n=1 Tax=Arenivirga flava TaxID=1930060 RepID=A0AA37XBU7_9MICO|nr:LacI family DNA-binding transcriptional regulator [Arenivirga flava]GMA29161.1 LacI family transcriptional regulator [Arenivirga flava]
MTTHPTPPAQGSDAASGVDGAPASRPATILDVAAAVGVSRQTVTRAMNDLPGVNAATRERVLEAARQLNYRPNRAAQGLVRGREITVGLVVDDLRNPYYPELASEFSRAAAGRGWGVLLSDLGADPAVAAERLASLALRVDAVVSFMALGALRPALGSIPVVQIGAQQGDGIAGCDASGEGRPDAGDAIIGIDDPAAVRDAVEHLLAGGRRRIAMIDHGPVRSVRAAAYERMLAERGSHPLVIEAAHGDGVRAAEALLDAEPRADAVLVFNDVLAIGALRGLSARGVRVPEDVAVVGMDGLDVSALVTPALTTLAIDLPGLAAHAAELADAVLRGERPAPRTVARELVVRESA